MRIGCLQFAPQVGDIDNNLNRADAVLSKANPDGLDILVLPELAFTGYNFKSLQDITPFLEPVDFGITALWARTVALKYNCTVTVGYPEKVDPAPRWPTGPEYYNSAIVVNSDGKTIVNYRKSHLYYTDESWALEGDRGFYDGLIPGLGNTSLGICMDINPYKFEAPWQAFEFAYHVLDCESEVVIISMAWMTREEPRNFSRMPNKPDMETLIYWVTRLEPLIRSDNKDEIVVIFCNRTGTEDDATYAGTSAVIGIQDGKVFVYGLLGRGEKELLLIDTANPPCAELERTQSDSTGDATGSSLEREEPSDAHGRGPTAKSGAQSDTEEQQSQGSDTQTLPSIGSMVSSTTASDIPPVPELPAHFATSPTSPTSSGRQRPSITIPDSINSCSVNSDSARSISSSAYNFPTPSGPSPTPMVMRPKLAIPQSPPIIPHQYPSSQPMSAISAFSEKSEQSVQSTQSFKSDESVQTVRSNHRPPEESTPYPESSVPLSGYYENKWKTGPIIYGGSVQISHESRSFSPSTPFEDMSPLSALSSRSIWRLTESNYRTPTSASAWTPGTPIGRKAEPSPWPMLKPSPAPTAVTPIDRASANVTPRDTRKIHSQSPQSNTSSNKTNKTNKSKKSNESARSNGTSKLAQGEEMNMARPSSPKSRNASRSRNHKRSDSALSHRDTSGAVSRHLENISHRAESVTRMRGESGTSTPVVNRSQPSRNGSRLPRPESAMAGGRELHSISIVASPSVFSKGFDGTKSSQSPRPSSRVDGRQRRGSSAHAGVAFARPDSSVAIPDHDSTEQRASSRGRQPGPSYMADVPSDIPPGERAGSADSTRNGVLHTRVPRHHSSFQSPHNGMRSANRRASESQRRSSQASNAADTERADVCHCSACLVHERHATLQGETSTQPQHHHHSANHDQLAPPVEGGSTIASMSRWRETTDSGEDMSADSQQTSIAPTMSMCLDTADETCAGDRAQSSDYSTSAETPLTISKSRPWPAKPSLFNPTTPKAMVFAPDESTDMLAED